MRSFSFLTKLTLFGLLLSTLPVLMIGIFSYATSSNEIQKYVNEGKIQLLKQINANVEQILTTVNHTLNQTINSTALKKAVSAPLTVNDFMTYDNIRNELRHMQSFDTLVEDVVLVNVRQNWMVKNSGLYPFDRYEQHEALLGLMNGGVKESWELYPSRWFYSEESASSIGCPYTLSLTKKLPVNGLETHGFAMANIPACSLQALLSGENPADTTLVLDESYRILAHPDPSLIGRSVAATGFDRTDQMHGQSGQIQADLGGGNYSVAYYRSPYNGWTYVSFVSISSLTRESNKIGFYTLFICLLLLLAAILFVWLGSRKIYSPIQKLLLQLDDGLTGTDKRRKDEFGLIGEQLSHLFQSKSRLEKEVRQHLGQVRAYFLIKAVQGNLMPGELAEQLRRFGFEAQLSGWRRLVVLTLQIDALEETRYGKEDSELLLFAVQNIVEEMIPFSRRLTPVTVDGTAVVVLGSPDPEAEGFNSALLEIAEQLQTNVHRYLGLQISIGMSLPFDSFSRLEAGYREGLDALKHRLKLGKGIIIQYGNLNSGHPFLNLNYPTLVENELIDAIKLAEQDKARELLKQFLQPVFRAELSPQECQLALVRLLNNLLIVAQESGIQLPRAGGSLFEQLLALNTVPEIEDWFAASVVFPMIAAFRDRQEAQYQNISEQIIDLVQRCYDTDLTLEECASRLHYNANYLSSVFRKETQVSFSEYLSAYRFGMAKKWLTETDLPIKEIAAKLRYNNPQNFIRSFRKQEGMTPGQYRERKLRA
ncbi:helix-turn-helix domain-containing protein [Cohnella hongkongensis]|uniref:Helix-turn-helix domain-containing protein n=1 Tax=Cohnella hongkongensis TaxID=178337 RepID=A0ABV9F8N5_9BACL